MLQNAFHTSKCLNNISTVVVQVPQFSIVALVCPPERILLQHLELLEISAHTPAFVISQCVTILLEQCVDSRDTPIPGVLHKKKKVNRMLHNLLKLPLEKKQSTAMTSQVTK